MRILITGSRMWVNREAIAAELSSAIVGVSAPVVVHGGCPTGADAIADRLARLYGCAVEVYEADWDQHGRAAGPVRNQKMVDLGADVCLAFPLGDSRGTRDCMRRAFAAGIPVREVADA